MSGSKKFWVENDSAPKMLWVQRNLEFKEIWAQKIWLNTDPLFETIAQRFLIKTNFCKIFGLERFGSKEVVVAFMLE